MGRAAVPEYIGKLDHATASPGMRFGMLLGIWSDQWAKTPSVTEDLKRIARCGPDDEQRMNALAARQDALAETMRSRGRRIRIEAVSIAPFTTGLGNEHPLENGFAFLDPYGLPYLPGSGVKGVLRRSASELEWAPNEISALFGGDPGDTGEAYRGAITCWDVIPQGLKSLSVEVMTPHQSAYHQSRGTPHDSGAPVPIQFLTVPPGTRFVFHVRVDDERFALAAPDSDMERLPGLVEELFVHAFDWLGFGAKTSVGYGAMRRDKEAERRRETAIQERVQAAERKKALDRMSQADRVLYQFDERMQAHLTRMGGKGGKVGGAEYQEIQRLVAEASAESWSPAERSRAADAVEKWAVQLIERMDAKEARRRFGLAALRGGT